MDKDLLFDDWNFSVMLISNEAFQRSMNELGIHRVVNVVFVYLIRHRAHVFDHEYNSALPRESMAYLQLRRQSLDHDE